MNIQRLCIISLKSFDIITNSAHPRHIGGNEINQAALARELILRGYQVSIITHDNGQEDGKIYNGITVITSYKPETGLPIIRFFHPRWSKLWSALRRANAGIYCQMGSGAETGQIALWCRLHKRRFVFSTAADADCISELSYLPSIRERLLFRYGLKHADRIICQTSKQQSDLKKSFSVESIVVRSSTQDPKTNDLALRILHQTPAIGWIGRFVAVKRLEWIFDLADMIPRLRFSIIGWGDESQEYVSRLIERSKTTANITLHGRISPNEINSVYESIDLLACTSSKEGVPTVFIEAWARGIPVISTVDPDGVIAANQLGMFVNTLFEMRDSINTIISNTEYWTRLSRNTRIHYERHHKPEVQVAKYETIFKTLLDRSQD
jgi:glycosyltransferase involved in cell wall biosynthesis